MTPATTFLASVSVSGDPVFRECDRGDQRAAPGAEILGREFVAHVLFDVVVEARAREVAKRSVNVVAKELPAARKREQLLHRVGKLCVDDRGADENAVLAPVLERDPAPAHGHVPLP